MIKQEIRNCLQRESSTIMAGNAIEMDVMKAEDVKVEPNRESWGHKAEFLLASIGLAVGLGTVWRFPYLCQKNGGGAFLIPYIIFMVIEGLPLFMIEFAIGQRFRKTAILAWKEIHPALFGVGLSCLAVSFMLCVYYVIVLSWCVYYFFHVISNKFALEPKKIA